MDGTTPLETRTLRRASVAEIAIVLGAPTLIFLTSSIHWRLVHGPVVFTDNRLLTTLALEVVLTGLLLPYLLRRAWKPMSVTPPPETLDILRGILLWLSLLAALYTSVLVLYLLVPDAIGFLRARRFTGHVSPQLVVVGSLINPVFEEFLWLGYAIPAVASRFGLRVACTVSIVLRVAVHLYQGMLALIAVLPMAVVLTWYFVRARRLWPAVVAHVIVDAIGLSHLVAM